MSSLNMPRVLALVAVIIAAAVGVGAALLVLGHAVQDRTSVHAAKTEIDVWIKTVPGLEDVTVSAGSNLRMLWVEGEAATPEDLERLRDKLDAWDDIEFRVQVWVRGEQPHPLSDEADQLRAGQPLPDSLDAFRAGSIIVAGQPDANELAALRDMGVTVVMSNRHAGETSFDEQAVVESLGMTWIHLPYRGGEQLTDNLLDQALDVFRHAEGPVFAHCASGNRTGALLLAHLVLNEDRTWDAALADAKAAGLRSQELIDVVETYVKHRQ